MLQLEYTKKYLCSDEQEAELFIEKLKNECDGTLVDWKVSRKETKDAEYFIVSIKIRNLTLAEGKEKLYGEA